MRHVLIRALVISLALAVAFDAIAAKKKKKSDDEDNTQTLPLVKNLPAAITADTAHLVFHVSPLSSKGLLSQQVRDALKALLKENHRASIVKLRAFATGSGDLRRIQTLVSETFTDRKMPLPALSTVQVGALPLEGAEVVIESIAAEKKTVNPNGLAFFSGQQAKDAAESLAKLQGAVAAAGVKSASVVRATCFLSSLGDIAHARMAMSAAFPMAAADFVQLQRVGVAPLAECEAVGRLDAPPPSAVAFPGSPGAEARPPVALVNVPKIVFSGTQMAFGQQEADIRLAFERLQKTLEPLGVSYKDVFWSASYALTRPTADQVRKMAPEFYDAARPPAGTQLLFEGLESLDASAAIEVIAAQK